MPVFRSGSGLAPAWCELEQFDIVELLPGESYAFERVGQKQKLIVGKGRCRIAVNGVSVTADEGANLDLETTDGRFEVLDVFSDATLICMDGRWGEEVPLLRQSAWRHEKLIQQFVRWLDADHPMATNIEDNLQSVAMIFGAIESSRTGQPVRVQELLARTRRAVKAT